MNIVTIKRILKIFFITILGFCYMVITTPIVVPVFGAFWIASYLWFFIMKLKFGKLVNKPDGMDIVNGKENEKSKPYINIVGRFTKHEPTIDKIRNHFQRIVLEAFKDNGKQKFRKFTQVLTELYGYYIWKDAEEFDVKNHIREIDQKEILDSYNKEMRAIYGQDAANHIQENSSDLSHIKWEIILKHFLYLHGNRPVQKGLPKWEILLLQESETIITCLFRVHHSITDGIYFVRLITECLADYPVEIRLPYNYRRPNLFIRGLLNLWSFSLLPYGLYRLLRANDKNPLHGIKLNGEKRYYMSDPISLDMLKDIKRGAKVTINDIIFSCVSHATSAHFIKRNALVKNITVLLAVNLQAQNKPLKLKNDFAITALKIPTSTSAIHWSSALKYTNLVIIKDLTTNELFKYPALTRLQIVKNSLDEAKSDPCLMSVCWLITSFSALLPVFVSEALLATTGITMDVSNVQGPQTQDLVIDEAPATAVCFFLPDRDPLGIAVSISSYSGHLRVGLTVDKALMPEDDEGIEFLETFRDEVLSLHREVDSIISTNGKEEKEMATLQDKIYTDIP